MNEQHRGWVFLAVVKGVSSFAATWSDQSPAIGSGASPPKDGAG